MSRSEKGNEREKVSKREIGNERKKEREKASAGG